MLKAALLIPLILAPAGLAPAATPAPAKAPAHVMAMAPMSADATVQSAMSAAPTAVGRDATVITVDAKGAVTELRKGTNGFTCMADNPETPGPDPMCGDANAMAWAQAWIEHRTPPAGKVGFLYMLAGGTDASNTDPYAQGPART